MPIYEYECKKCGKTAELMQKFSDPPATTCHECGGPLTKLMSRTTFQLKGSGWYATDYKKPSSTKSEETPKPKPATDKGKGSSGE